MLVLDTDSMSPGSRPDALRDAMTSTLVPSQVTVDRTGPVTARIHAWQLAGGVDLVHVASSGLRITRDPGHLRGGAEERISLAIQHAGRMQVDQRGLVQSDLHALQLVDMTSPFDYRTGDGSVAQALYVDTGRLGLRVDDVRRAAPRLPVSPLYGLTRSHLVQLPQLAATVPGHGAALLGSATAELVRALIATAAESRHGPAAMAESLMTRITAYMRAHLGEADLDPARIAAEHHISVRYLHLLFARHELSVRRWLMQERLEGARRALAHGTPGAAGQVSIATVARRYGFTDPGHFAKRFRAAYGMSPREWQRLNAPPPRRSVRG
jgi:AraC-like DNA-binding protein